MKKIVSLVLALTLALGTLAGCGSSTTATTAAATTAAATTQAATSGAAETTTAVETEPEIKKVDTLIVGTTMAQNTFNATTQSDAFGRFGYIGFSKGNWVYQDETGALQPYFMTSFTISEDGKVLDFTFPTDAVWSDGQPVTADDVMFSFDFFKNTEKSTYMLTLEKWEITGEGQGRLTFSEASAYQYLVNTAMNHCCIPKHVWESWVGNEDYKSQSGDPYTVGCGAFRLVSNDVDAQISVYEAIPENNYHGEITINNVIIKTYSDQTAILMALINGEIDCYYSYSSPIDTTLMELIAGYDVIDAGESYYSGQNQITFGMTRSAGSDFNFRKAVLLSFDWNLLANVIGGESAEVPNTSLITPSCMGFDSSLPLFYQSIDEAKQILDEAGYKDTDGDGYREFPDGSKMEILVVPQYSKSMELRNRIAEVIIDNMAAIGVYGYVDQEIIASSSVWESNILDGNYDIAIGYTTSGIAKFRSAFRYYAAEPQPGTSRDSQWLWGTYKDETFNNTIWRMIASGSEEEYRECISYLQKENDEVLFGAALAWTMAYFPYRTDKIEGWDNWASWGVVNNDTWTTLTAK